MCIGFAPVADSEPISLKKVVRDPMPRDSHKSILNKMQVQNFPDEVVKSAPAEGVAETKSRPE